METLQTKSETALETACETGFNAAPSAATVRRCIMAQAARLRELVLHLTPLESSKLAHAGIERSIARGRFREDWALFPLPVTVKNARRIVRAAAIKDRCHAIEAAYVRACADMNAVGLDFGILIA